MIGVVKGMWTTLKTTFRHPVTKHYPDEHLPLAERYWGFPSLIWDPEHEEPRCTGCGICQRECPPGAIVITDMKENPKFPEGQSQRKKIIDRFLLDIGRCMVCNICVEVCPFDALTMSHVHEVSGYTRRELRAEIPRLLAMTQQKAGGD